MQDTDISDTPDTIHPPVVRKRDGSEQLWNSKNVETTVRRAFDDVGVDPNGDLMRIVNEVAVCARHQAQEGVIAAEHLRLIIKKTLLKFHYGEIAEAFSDSAQVAQQAGHWEPMFMKPTGKSHPFDTIEWVKTDAKLLSATGQVIFEVVGIEVPATWSQQTVNIVADKYFRVIDGVRETSAKQMFTRVADRLTTWAFEQNYFNGVEDANTYKHEMLYALVHQFGAFNSPVWFNLGVPGRRQMGSACFISSLDDSLESIAEFQAAEIAIFRSGSGSGVNVSNLRSSYEKISAGAYTSGPLAFMKGNDQYAGAMKSGGGTRSAAKLVAMDMDHPDILETKDGRPGFLKCKAGEEKLAHQLVDIGYPTNYDDPNGAYKRVQFQNANISASISDAFMQAVEADGNWETKARTTGETIHTYKARDLWNALAESAWVCGDPGVQFSDTMNKWHTTPKAGRIRGSNPCFAPGTRIATVNGPLRIEDIAASGDAAQVVIPVDGTMAVKSVDVFCTGENPIVEVLFASGRLMKVTPDHGYRLRDGSRCEAAKLTAGDTVDIQPSEGGFGNIDINMREQAEWFQLAGFLVGDGWMTKSGRGIEAGMCFGKDDDDCMERVVGLLTRCSIPHSIKLQAGSVGESPRYLRIRKSAIVNLLADIACPFGSVAHTKRVADTVFRAQKVDQLAYLAGLFSADGTFRVSAKGHHGKIPTRELRLASISAGLLRDVQALLLNLGIKSTIQLDRNKRTNVKTPFKYTTVSGEEREYTSAHNCHELFVYGHSLRKLRDGWIALGGMFSSRKQKRMEDLLPKGYSAPIHDIWYDTVKSVTDHGETAITYNMTEPDTHTIVADGVHIFQCSEFLHVDDTACNLCAVNLTKFFNFSVRQFNAIQFEHVCRIFSTAQMAIVARADYPTEKIRINSHKLRPIGLNYGNLGALLMRLGFGYDSNEGRAVAARLASLMTGVAYQTSAKLAARVGAFSEFSANRRDMLKIMRMHQTADAQVTRKWETPTCPIGSDHHSARIWRSVITLGERYGYNISQATLQAPLGCIGFLMGMDTTGIEPAFALVSYKSMVGGGYTKLVIGSVGASLTSLGYTSDESAAILRHIDEHSTVDGAPHIKPEHLAVFDCASASGPSGRCLTPRAHLLMMSSIQPLITCAMSKTCNLPSTVTAKEIADVYMEGWKLGLKCIAVYRDGCKASQPLSSKKSDGEKAKNPTIVAEKLLPPVKIGRDKLPMDVTGWRHKFDIAGHKGYILVSEYPDGRPGEVFLKLGKPGTTVAGFVDSFTRLLSVSLQHGVPLDLLIKGFVNTKFDPSGITKNPDIRFCDSIVDYLFKLLQIHYDKPTVGKVDPRDLTTAKVIFSEPPRASIDAPPCQICGTIMNRSGSCHTCPACGASSGCA
jgi:ribonucleoside-diphosphate reductase alpha chain